MPAAGHDAFGPAGGTGAGVRAQRALRAEVRGLAGIKYQTFATWRRKHGRAPAVRWFLDANLARICPLKFLMKCILLCKIGLEPTGEFRVCTFPVHHYGALTIL